MVRIKIEMAMKLESDRMQNLVLSDGEFSKEIKVVMEERRWRTEDQPQALVEERLMAAAFCCCELPNGSGKGLTTTRYPAAWFNRSA